MLIQLFFEVILLIVNEKIATASTISASSSASKPLNKIVPVGERLLINEERLSSIMFLLILARIIS